MSTVLDAITFAPYDEATIDKWRTIARDTAWKDYAAKNSKCAELIKLAESIA